MSEPAPPPQDSSPKAAARRVGGLIRLAARFVIRHLRAFGIAASLLALILFFSVIDGLRGNLFVSPTNLQLMALQSVIIGLGSIGMTFIIISGGIDLSVGSVIALSMVSTAMCLQSDSPSLGLAALAGVATGLVAGFLNGVMITAFRLVPFIVTLGMMGMARGLAKRLTQSQPIDVDFEGWGESWLALLTVTPNISGRPLPPGTPELPGWIFFPPSFLALLVLVVAFTLILRYSVFGRHVFAIGSSENAARLCGVPVARVKILIYTLAGLFTGLAGVVFCSRQAQGDPTAAQTYELDIIAAVVIGGGSLNGGEGSILGSLGGILIMTVLRFGLRTINAPQELQEILIGAIIIVAVVVDQMQHRRWEPGKTLRRLASRLGRSRRRG